jgi:hypothetical protein
MRHTQFGGRRPYRILAPRGAPSGRPELWADARQARALRVARLDDAPSC